ncbi:hypothetical protein BpHYR1_036242 [Brachionus plicatilis]|uniref:MYND-type domain-containing protein n=1 Tax=Brachionus plicatilis TaxID=10195 RepID=A0A3M7RH27_BRAPC|nr:hypothetical protein BpHYR1_036242 [Brachionus plicatilis]
MQFFTLHHLDMLALNKDKSQARRIVEQYFKKGELAEKDQLPCFLPYDSQTKTKLQNCLDILDLNNNLTVTKAVRNEPRTYLIRKHRQMIYEMQTKFLNSNYSTLLTSFKAPKTQKQPHSMAILKEIQLKEIDFTRDEVLTGRVLTVRVFDLPSFGFTSIFFLIDDGENTMQRLSVYNLGKDYEQISEDFKMGTWISIMNPYVRQAMDGEAMIRVDDPKSIVFSGKISEKVCSYCSKSNSKFSCSKCLKVSYCDKECQIKDWKEQNHKLVCFKS